MSSKGRFVFGEKTKLLFRSLFLFSLLTFFIAGVTISRAETCECTTNTAFGGGNPCTGGTCDGCHCNYSNCTPNCACASSTAVGSTCSNGCGGTCNGTKTGGATKDIQPLSASSYKSIWQFQMTEEDGDKRPAELGYKYFNSPDADWNHSGTTGDIQLSAEQLYNCDNYQFIQFQNVTSCDYSRNDLQTFKFYLVPGAVSRVSVSSSQGNGGSIFIVRFGEPPQGSYNKSDLIDGAYFGVDEANVENTTGKDFIKVTGDGLQSVFEGSLPEDATGGWVYIRVIPNNADMQVINYSANAKYDKYKVWYDNMTANNEWGADGDPSTGGVVDTSDYKSIWQFPMDYMTYNWVTETREYRSSSPLGYKEVYSNLSPNIGDSGEIAHSQWTLFSCGSYATVNSVKCYHSNEDMHKVKVFFPPGEASLTVRLGTTQTNDGSRVIVVARFGQPPQGDYDNESIFSRTDVSNDVANFSQVNGKDFLTSNGDGLLDVFHDRFDENFIGGWLYLRIFESNKKILDIDYFQVSEDFEKYKAWYDNMTATNQWQANGDPPETDPSVLPTGPDCASKTCVGNSCDSESTTAENPWISGTKTAGCATGEAKASPSSITPKVEWTTETPAEEISYLTWTANNAKALEVGCTGPTLIDRGSMQLTSALWQQEAATTGFYTKPSSTTPDGYPAWFPVGASGTEVCTFYPTNETDGLPGTPFSLTIQVLGNSTCGNNIVEGTEECDYTSSTGLNSDVLCPTGKTCEDCKCVALSDANKYVCQPDDSGCAKNTCKDVKCFDGCNYRQGTKDCKGRE